MRRWLGLWAGTALLVGGSFAVLSSLASEKTAERPREKTQGAHTITVTPWGPDQPTIDETKTGLLKSRTLQPYLAGKNYRMLSFDLLENGTKDARPGPPSRYRATFFNYTSNQAIIASGRFKNPAVEVSVSSEQPVPSPEEFEAAVSIVSKDPTFGPAIRNGSLQPYPSMPPLVDINLPAGKAERTLTVGLMSKDGPASNEVVGVNMIRESVLRYEGGAPPTSKAAPDLNCGVPTAGQPTTSAGTSGQYQVTISRGSDVIWEFLCIRPSASSGSNRSGIELRDVKYRGKMVLSRANVPILNVQYYRNVCGPYRDWAWQEGMFVANGSYVVGDSGSGGIMLCTDEPQTVLDNGTDTGNFRGIAIYDREEVTLVSELNAGWYRYISKWTFGDEGIISPRFGFGMITNSCVCQGHIHHVYWRFDFDIVTAANNSVAEFYQSSLKTIGTESMRARLSPDQYWLVSNSVTGEGVSIKPGPQDGNYDKYSHGDLWLLRSHFPLEIDDAGTGGGTDAHIDQFVNQIPETIENQDVVVWYAAHKVHDHFDSPTNVHGDGPGLVGPDLILQKY